MSGQVAILAGGLANRLKPLSQSIAKSMIPIRNYPFIGWQLKLLAKSGIHSVVLCLGHRSQEISEFVGNGDDFGLKVQYSIEETPLGTGGALKKAEYLLEDYFGVLYGDSFLTIDYTKIIHLLRDSKALGVMTIYENKNQIDRSNVFYTSKGELKYSKRFFSSEMDYIDYGFTVLRKKALLEINKLTPYDLSFLFERLSGRGELEAYVVQDRFYEIGSFGGIQELEELFESEQK